MQINNEFANQFFASIAAGCPRKRDEVARLRHQVFCQEFKFEPENTQQREQDCFDEYAEFALIKSKPNLLAAGCLRVIMPARKNQLLPMEQYCSQAIKHSRFNLTGLPRKEICEVSRLAVHVDFRGRNVNTHAGIGRPLSSSHKKDSYQYASLVSLALLTLAAIIAQKHGRPHVLSMMEPRLARGLRLGGIPVTQAGDIVEYHGKRAPYYVTADDLLSGIAWRHPALIETIEQQMNADRQLRYRPAGINTLYPPRHDGRLIAGRLNDIPPLTEQMTMHRLWQDIPLSSPDGYRPAD